MKIASLPAVLFLVLLVSCASFRSLPDNHSGLTLDHSGRLSEITYRDLRNAKGTLVLTCPFTHSLDAKYISKCHKDAAAFVEEANRYWSEYVGPIHMTDIIFDNNGGACLDTFVPGREAADCFSFIYVRVPIKLK
jgi:hypothetical protein